MIFFEKQAELVNHLKSVRNARSYNLDQVIENEIKKQNQNLGSICVRDVIQYPHLMETLEIFDNNDEVIRLKIRSIHIVAGYDPIDEFDCVPIINYFIAIE